MLMFGFEVDTLEVQLREVVDLVDVIFIVEATVTHHGVGRATLKLESISISGKEAFDVGKTSV